MQQTITFLEDDATSRVIGVDDILFAAPAMTILPAPPVAPESDDDDVPIAANLETKLKKTKTKRKKVKQQRWDYELVAEPTGVASNYWDAAAPVERATKRVAKQKIKEIQDGELIAPLLPDGNSGSVVPEVVDVARKDNTKRTGKQRRSELIAVLPDGELTAALLPDGQSVIVVPEVVNVARKDKTKRTAKKRRSDLQAFMENQRLLDEASNILIDEALASPTGSGKRKVCISFSKCINESRYYNCFLCFFEHKAKLKNVKKGRTKQELLKQKNSDDAMMETNTSCLAGKQLANMTAEQRVAVNEKLNTTLKKQINKTVKAAVIAVRFNEVAEAKFVETLRNARCSAWSMVHKARPTLWEEYGVLARVKVGDWVHVLECYKVGECSEGGIGCVTFIHNEVEELQGGIECAEGGMAVNVKYVLTNTTENAITMDRITVIPMPYKDTTSALGLRKRKVKDVQQPETVIPQKTAMEWLQWGKLSRRHETAGWLKNALVHFHLLDDNPFAVWKRVIADYKTVNAIIEGMKLALGNGFVDPRDYKGKQGEGGQFVSDKSKSQALIPKNEYTIPYLLHAYDVKRTSFQRRVKADKMGKYDNIQPISLAAKGHTCIDDINIMRNKFTPRFFFARAHAMAAAPPPIEIPHWGKYTTRAQHWATEYDSLVAQGKDVSHWDRMAREHAARQPFIANELVAILQACDTTSFRDLSTRINGWCSAATIEAWFKQHPTYSMYVKNIKPGLTADNKVKQVAFSNRVHRRWDLPSTTKRILWIHSDEKWFWALVGRKNAKACPEIGVEKSSYSAHHKSHIGKVMAHCTVGFLFDGEVENGGQGFLIALHRCQAPRIPLRNVYFSSRNPLTGKIVYKGNAIKHHVGVPYNIDCNVTGSNRGTPYKPCFPVKYVWEHSLLPAIEEMVSVGGPCAGAQVVFQEDNAGPHTEGDYTSWMLCEFEKRGWKLELQAPQGLTYIFSPFNLY